MSQRPHHRNPAAAAFRAARGNAPEPGAPDVAQPAGSPSPEELAAEVERLQAEAERLGAELDAARAQATDHLASLQRSAADFANFRRRTAEDRERDLGLASESLLRKVIGIADDFDRALEAMPAEIRESSWIEGIVLVDRKLRQLLESEGVTPIEAVGRPFDPREHEAIATWAAPGAADGDVVAEIQRGYRIRDRILRPARVAVAAAGNGGSAGGGAADAPPLTGEPDAGSGGSERMN